MPNFNSLFSIPAVKLAAGVAGAALVAALIFDAGVDAGMHRTLPHEDKRMFFRAFGVPLPHTVVGRGHGAFGLISEVGTSTIVVTERDGSSETVWVNDNTVIEAPGGPTTTSAFRSGVQVIIIGAPNESHDYMQAKFIRVLPPPPQGNY